MCNNFNPPVYMKLEGTRRDSLISKLKTNTAINHYLATKLLNNDTDFSGKELLKMSLDNKEESMQLINEFNEMYERNLSPQQLEDEQKEREEEVAKIYELFPLQEQKN